LSEGASGSCRRGAPLRATLRIALLVLLFACPALGSDARPFTAEEKEFQEAVVNPVMTLLQKALPPAPAGWVVASDTRNIRQPAELVSADRRFLRARTQIAYKRIEGVKAEQRHLEVAYAESQKRHKEAAKPLIDELIKQQTETSLKLRTATRRRNAAEEKRLNDELEENGRKMRALHEEMDKAIRQDVEPYLVKDAEASLLVSVNDSWVEFPQSETLSQPQAAFAFQQEGERTGATTWREGRTLILYGDWQAAKPGAFQAKGERQALDPKARTIVVLATGDRKRVEELLKQMDLKAVQKLLR